MLTAVHVNIRTYGRPGVHWSIKKSKHDKKVVKSMQLKCHERSLNPNRSAPLCVSNRGLMELNKREKTEPAVHGCFRVDLLCKFGNFRDKHQRGG